MVEPSSAFDEIYEELFMPVYRYVRIRVPSQDVDDITAEVLAKVWRALPAYEERAALKSWALKGLQNEFISGIPEELKPYWAEDMNFHTHQWWNDLWEKSGAVEIKEHREMECFDEAWNDWLACDNDFARHDIDMIKADHGKYFNLVSITAIRR